VRRVDPWRLGVLAVSAVLCADHLHWGLPNGPHSWAVDAFSPITVLGIVRRSFAEWNTGWFYFKYPLGHPLLLAASYTPYLGWLWACGAWQPAAQYPYGFADPERALFVLAMTGRVLSVLFAVGTVAVTFALARRLFGRGAAVLSAWFVATCYPLVYYAHTTNLDAGYLFWLILALYGAVVAAETERGGWWAVLGVAAAMAVSTKEQGFAFLLPLPVLAIAGRARRVGWAAAWRGQPVVLMSLAALGTAVAANNVLFNPLGFVGRVAYLLGHPLQPVEARLAPLEFAWFKGAREWTYLRQLADALDSGLGTPLLVVAVLGAGVLWWNPRAARWLLVPALTHYYVSLRGLELITLRYVLPLLVIGSIVAAALVVRGFERGGWLRRAVAVVGVGLAVLGLARAVELDVMLRTDPRYAAEAWMRTAVLPGARIEAYQKRAFLPRFPVHAVVQEVPAAQRTVAELVQRQPDFLVLSSQSRQSITHRWNPDWRTTRTLLVPIPGAVEWLAALERGALGYQPVATFARQPRLIRSRITSLAPTITVYARPVTRQ
jgi:4-amino-4-deoxy-L-arabinose transferase-like glycosyltransferase